MPGKREHTRYVLKVPAEIRSGDVSINGTTVRLSEKGCFVRCQRNFKEGLPVEVVISLPDGNTCRLKGTVKYSRNLNLGALKRDNGMGIEFSGTDPKYIAFVKSIEQQK